MASVHRAKGRKIWVAYYRDVNKKLIGRSTGVTKKADAKIIAAAYEKASREQRSLRVIARVLSEMHQLVGGVGKVDLVIARDYIERWLKHKKDEIAASSYKNYLASTRKFLEFLGERAERPLIEFVKSDIVDYRSWLAAKVGPQRTNDLLANVRAIFSDAVREGILSDSPAEHVGTLTKKTDEKRRAFSLPELQAVMAVAGPEWQSMIRFGLFTGQRLMDLAHLRWSNLDLEKNVIRLTTGKTGRTMVIPISETLKEHVASLPAADNPQDFLHPDLARSQQSSLSTQFARLLADAGLRPPRGEKGAPKSELARSTNELVFHSLRHTATSLLKEAGIPQAVVGELIGHDSKEVSQGYTHVGEAALKLAINALPKI
jgi:integrase